MAKYEDGVMYYFIINPASQSGRGYKIWEKIEQRLVRDGVEYQAYLTEYAGQATEYARKLTSHCKEARVIVVVGGDGTVNEVVDGIVSCDMVTVKFSIRKKQPYGFICCEIIRLFFLPKL